MAGLQDKIIERSAIVGVIGLGYVGLPLAVAFAEAGFRVVGFDINAEKVTAINNGNSYVRDVASDALRKLGGRLTATTDYSVLNECDAVSICVPTPLSKSGDPDVSFIIAAVDEVSRYLHREMLVVLESTTYPGTTTDIVLPRLSQNGSGLRVGEDFHLCFSPERIDPGRQDWTTQTTPKVIGGVTPRCLEVGMLLYGSVLDELVPVSSTEAAEMVKIVENAFRAVNIAFANEVMLMCDKLGLDVWEVIEAAATKPFGFMKFTPGPGIGGHCIPIDPLYLSWRLKAFKYRARFIELADDINSAMPYYWVQRVQDALNTAMKPLKGSRVLVLGVSYKADVPDLRESPALDIIHILIDKGARVSYHDPYVSELHHGGLTMYSVESLDAALDAADCVIIVTDHSWYDWDLIRRRSNLVVDTRNALRERGLRKGQA